MLDIFKAYATDEKRENEGVAVELGGGATMTIARLGNANYVRMLQAEGEKHAEALRTLPTVESEKLDREILTKVLAETILVGFSGVSYKGKELKYSVANAVKLLEIKDFRHKVITEANNIERYRLAVEEEATKN